MTEKDIVGKGHTELSLSEKAKRAAVSFVEENNYFEIIDSLKQGGERQVSLIFSTTTRMIAYKYRSGEIGQRDLSDRLKELMRLDDSKDEVSGVHDYRRVKKSLLELEDETLKPLLQALPNNLLINNLDMMDVDFCSPKRIAGYIRFNASLISRDLARLNRVRFKKGRKNYNFKRSLSTDLGIHREKLENLLMQTIDRDGADKDSIDFVYEVAQELRKEQGGFPKYVFDVLIYMSDKGMEAAEEFLSVLEGD